MFERVLKEQLNTYLSLRRSRGFRRESSVFRCSLIKATGSPTKALGDDGFKFFRIAIVSRERR